MTIRQDTLLAFGAGYAVRALAPLLSRRGWRVLGTQRDEAGFAELEAIDIAPLLFDGTSAGFAPPDGAHWLISIPPDEAGCPVLRVFADHSARAASITYLSTTGVYGDLRGGWAFEWSPLRPRSDRAKRRVLAERGWLAARPDARLVRLPGIYGPGRSPIDRIREGRARRIVKAGQVFSRIHVADLARGLEALLLRSDQQGVFHLCDDVPVPPEDVVAYAASLIGLPPPPLVDFETADLSAMARSFYAECKRVSNARAKAALGWRPRFSDYRAGLRAVAGGYD